MDVSINEVGATLKTEPADYDENAVVYDDYFEEDQVDEDFTGWTLPLLHRIAQLLNILADCIAHTRGAWP